MSVSLAKYRNAVIDHDGIIYRGRIVRLNSAYVTIRVARVTGSVTGIDYSDLWHDVTAPMTFVRDLDDVTLYA